MTDIRAHNLTDEELIRWVRSSLTSTSIERELAQRFADLIDNNQIYDDLKDQIHDLARANEEMVAQVESLRDELAIHTTYEGND